MTRCDPLTAMAMAGQFQKKRNPLVATAAIWDRLRPQDQARIQVCLDDAAIQYKCKKSDLIWSMTTTGVVQVKKKETITLQ